MIMSGFWSDFPREFRFGNDRGTGDWSMAVLVTCWKLHNNRQRQPSLLHLILLPSLRYFPSPPRHPSQLQSWRLPTFHSTWRMVSLTRRRSKNTANTSPTSRATKSISISSSTSPPIAKVEEDQVSLSRPTVISLMKLQRDRGGRSGARRPRAAVMMASWRSQTSG